MAQKHIDKHEYNFREIERSMDVATISEDLEKVAMLDDYQQTLEEYYRFEELVFKSSLGPRYVSGNHFVFPEFDFDGVLLPAGNCSFRFDVGRGFVLDVSFLTGVFGDGAFTRTERIVAIIDRIVPEMKDGMRLCFDVDDQYSDSVVNLMNYPSRGEAWPPTWEMRIDKEKRGDFYIYHSDEGCFIVYHSVCVFFLNEPGDGEFGWMEHLLADLNELDLIGGGYWYNIVLWQPKDIYDTILCITG